MGDNTILLYYGHQFMGVYLKWIVGHGQKLYLIAIYIVRRSVVDSVQWNVESTLELDFKEVSTPMSPNSLYSNLIYYDNKIYESWIVT